MAKIPVYNTKRDAVGEIEVSDEVFGADVNEPLLYDVVKAQLASRRSGSANTRTRSEVVGSRKKLYKQKGTGRARHGTQQAPQFRGGGTQHGPKPRSYAWRPTRKMRRGALRSALSLKLKEGRLVVLDGFLVDEIKTKVVAQVMGALEANKSALVVDLASNDKLRLSCRNLPKHTFLPPEGVNVYDLLRHEHLIVTKDVLPALEARASKQLPGKPKAA